MVLAFFRVVISGKMVMREINEYFFKSTLSLMALHQMYFSEKGVNQLNTDWKWAFVVEGCPPGCQGLSLILAIPDASCF